MRSLFPRVERSAKSLAADADDAELQGTLKRTPFARLLQRLYAKRATGSLLLLRDTTKKIVIFVEGYPVSVRSNVLGTRSRPSDRIDLDRVYDTNPPSFWVNRRRTRTSTPCADPLVRRSKP